MTSSAWVAENVELLRQTVTGLIERAEKERDEAVTRAEKAEAALNDPWRQAMWERAKSAERECYAHRLVAEKAERERDEARAEFHKSNEQHCRHIASLEERAEKAERAAAAMRAALELESVEVSLARTWCRICRTEHRADDRSRTAHPHAAECPLASDAGREGEGK